MSILLVNRISKPIRPKGVLCERSASRYYLARASPNHFYAEWRVALYRGAMTLCKPERRTLSKTYTTEGSPIRAQRVSLEAPAEYTTTEGSHIRPKGVTCDRSEYTAIS